MKNILCILLIVQILFSCKSNKKSAVKDTVAITSVSHGDSIRMLVRRFSRFMNGEWVKKDYVEDMAKTKSPLVSYDKAEGMTEVSIDMNKTAGDSLILSSGWNNHEGGELTVKLKIGQTPTSLKTTLELVDDKPGDFYEIGYKIHPGDTNVIFYHYNKNKKLVTATAYVKELPQTHKRSKLSDAGYRIINEHLIVGTYLVKDSIGSSFKVTLDNEGNMSGFPGFKSYSVNIDFAEGPRENLDRIWFDYFDRNNSKSYAYKIGADTVKLYDVSDNGDSTSLILGKLKYRFIKQK